MTSQRTGSRNGKAIVSAAIAVLVFATLFYKLDGAASPACHFLGKAVWAALEVLRLGAIFARWYGVAAYLYESSGFVQHFLQVGASIWPFFSSIASLGAMKIS